MGVLKTFLAFSTNSGSGFICTSVSKPNAAFMITSKAKRLKRRLTSTDSPSENKNGNKLPVTDYRGGEGEEIGVGGFI